MLSRLFRYSLNIIFYSLVILTLFVGVRRFIVQPFEVSGQSMEGTIHHGEHLLLWKNRSIERYDIVVFPDPRGSGQSYVKRVIGLPGDRLQVIDDQLYLNDIPVEEPYLEPYRQQSGIQPFTDNFSLYDTIGMDVIPEGYCFVMGDNRPGSGDSRQFGLIALTDIAGEADGVYLPIQQQRHLTGYELTPTYQVVAKP